MSKKVKAAAKKEVKGKVVAPKSWSDRFVFDKIPKFVGEEMPKRIFLFRHSDHCDGKRAYFS